MPSDPLDSLLSDASARSDLPGAARPAAPPPQRSAAARALAADVLSAAAADLRDGADPNGVREVVLAALARLDGREATPLDRLRWEDPAILVANGYNPNTVFTPEMELLKVSILRQGWTQPIVALPPAGGTRVIVDGFHRTTLGRFDAAVSALGGGRVPVVTPTIRDDADQRAATVRHNRARGQHGIVAMASLVRDLLAAGRTRPEIETELGMEPEEIDRLATVEGSPTTTAKESYGRGWVPKPATADQIQKARQVLADKANRTAAKAKVRRPGIKPVRNASLPAGNPGNNGKNGT